MWGKRKLNIKNIKKMKKELTGKWFIKPGWFGFVIYVEKIHKDWDDSDVAVFVRAGINDLVKLNLLKINQEYV